jgi:hypothetical protein
MFVTNAKIKTPMELKGKSVGVNSLSGGGWIFSMLMLDYWGLVPERDKIQFRTLGEQAVIAQGVLRNNLPTRLRYLVAGDRGKRNQRVAR